MAAMPDVGIKLAEGLLRERERRETRGLEVAVDLILVLQEIRSEIVPHSRDVFYDNAQDPRAINAVHDEQREQRRTGAVRRVHRGIRDRHHHTRLEHHHCDERS